ncbi:MAG: hypothetical protein FWG33_04335 [Oscillospiraceae bacterium]|nr:hypothetical protein [Oscillospiraceae bacterium]
MKTKRMISLMVTLAIVLSIMPVATLSSTEPSVSVQLMARTTYNDDPNLREKTIKSTPVEIDKDGDYSVTLTEVSSRSYTDLAIRSVGTEFGEGAAQLGSSIAAPVEFEDAKIEITSIEATGTNITLQSATGISLVSSDSVMQKRVAVQLWNAYYAQDNRIGASSGITTPNVGKCNQYYQDPSCVCTSTTWESCPREVFALVFPNATVSIKVNFKVSGIDGDPAVCDVCDKEDCVNRACVPDGALPVRLAARTTSNGGTLHKSNAVMITATDNTYTATVALPSGAKQIANLALRAPGASWGESGDEVGTAVLAPAAFNEATITITSVTANSGLTGMGVQDGSNLPLIATGSTALAGYADIQLWNAWSSDAERISGVTTVDNTEWAGKMLSFPTTTTSVTVKFVVSMDGSGTCEDGTCKKAGCPVCLKNACPTCEDLSCTGCLDIILQSRVLWFGGISGDTGWNTFYESDVLRIKKDDANKTYTRTVNINQRHTPCTFPDRCCELLAVTDIRIGQKGTLAGDGVNYNVNPGNAVKNLDGPFREAAVAIKSVKINEQSTSVLDHYVHPWLVARDDNAKCKADLGGICDGGAGNKCTPEDWRCPRDVQEGFASAFVWNSWWEPHQFMKTGAGTDFEVVFRGQDGYANMLGYAKEENITSITVEFSLCFTEEGKDRCTFCNSCETPNCANCGGCDHAKFDNHQVCGCAQCFPAQTRLHSGDKRTGADKIMHGNCNWNCCSKPTCIESTTKCPETRTCNICRPTACNQGKDGKPCKKVSCIAICNPNNAWKAAGDTTGDGKVDIFDCLEILKYLIGMKNTISDGGQSISTAQAKKAAVISTQGAKAGEPTIFCVLEILKYMIKMQSTVDGYIIEPEL